MWAASPRGSRQRPVPAIRSIGNDSAINQSKPPRDYRGVSDGFVTPHSKYRFVSQHIGRNRQGNRRKRNYPEENHWRPSMNNSGHECAVDMCRATVKPKPRVSIEIVGTQVRADPAEFGVGPYASTLAATARMLRARIPSSSLLATVPNSRPSSS
jgi:hypothetical protein